MAEHLKVIKFEKDNIPVPYESKEVSDTKLVNYGSNNLYPNYLLELYNESPIHSAIINTKTTYIIGDGLKYKNGSELNFKVNASDNIKEFVDKVIKDYLIFNYVGVEVVYNVFGEPVEYHHVPAHKIRTNKSKTKFWFNDDWRLSRKHVTYDRWSPNKKDSTSKIFFFDGYFPTVNNVYSKPEYSGAIKAIATDIAIRDFNLNNIKNHFSVSNIITFFQGSNVPEEVKEQVIADLKASYTGENGKKIIVDFQNQDGKPAEVSSLSANDWSEAYEVLRKDTSDDILKGHQVTSPMLMGIKTEGQLGGATELETAYEIFKNTYIRVKRDEVESALNQLFSNFPGVTSPVKFADKPLFNSQLSESLKEKVLTINELRAEAGLPALKNGDRLISEVPKVSEPKADVVAQPTIQEDVKKKPEPVKRKLTEEDYEQVKHLGLSSEEFEILGEAKHEHHLHFDKESDIANYLLENDVNGLSLEELNSKIEKDLNLKLTESDLKDVLSKLTEAGVVDVKIDEKKGVQIQPNETADEPKNNGIFTMYKYEKRPDVNGADILSTSRSFCVKLIENDRLYTRAEIQTMGSIFGYDVYAYAGGFYHNPDTNETTPYCRHTWKAYSVKRKKQ